MVVCINRALIAKDMWRALFGNDLWSQIVRDKYMYGRLFSTSIRNGARRNSSVSYIWCNMMENLQWLLGYLRWDVVDGTKIEIGLANHP